MSKKIWKFTFPVTNRSDIPMPKGAKLLSVQRQDGDICVWALVDPVAPTETRRFAVYGTGQLVPDDPGAYVGTVQQLDGRLVWHVFEVPA